MNEDVRENNRGRLTTQGCPLTKEHVDMLDPETIIQKVSNNCDISDAHHAGLYSICGLALRLRDLYKWEHHLPPWEEQDSSDILRWIGDKEEIWEQLSEAQYCKIPVQGTEYDPYDTKGINASLESHGLFYGAGFAYSLKPTFLLAAIEDKRKIAGHWVYYLGEEKARDLLTLPALSQDRHIVFRKAATGLFLWDKMLYLKKSGRPALHFALKEMGLTDDDIGTLKKHFSEIFSQAEENFIYHELGELHDRVFDIDIWREMISIYPHTPVELLARVIKDLLADTNEQGTLHHIVQERKSASLGLFVAFFEGLAKEIFPELTGAFYQFMKTGDWEVMRRVVYYGANRARQYAEKMISIYLAGKEGHGKEWARNKIEESLLAKITRQPA
jgi:hypothetical protein